MGLRRPAIPPQRQDRRSQHFLFVLTEFEAFQQVYFFNINPEEYRKEEPNRVQVTQTIGGAFVDDFGVGVPTFNIRGHTGWHTSFDPSDLDNKDGVEFFKKLLSISRSATGDGLTHTFEDARAFRANRELVFINPQDGEGWEIVMNTFTLTRSASRPLLYQYDISFTGLRLLGSVPIIAGLDLIDSALLKAQDRVERAFTALENSLAGIDVVIPRIKVTTVRHTRTVFRKEYGVATVDEFDRVLALIRAILVDVFKFINRESSFIDIPITIFNDTVSAVRGVIETIDATPTIDPDAARNYKKLYYALISFDQSLFAGVVNSESIQGTSTGSQTFGLPPSALQNSPNALFDVSGTIIPQLKHEIFESKTDPLNDPKTITVSEDIAEVLGVFLLADFEEKNDFFESFAGRTITLKRNPSERYVARYRIQSRVVDLRQRVNSQKRIVVNDGDRLQAISLAELGQANNWQRIASLNGLEFPYLAPPDFVTEFKSTGVVTFFREAGFFPQIDIPIGTVVQTPGPIEGSLTYFDNIQFVTTEAVSMLAGVQQISAAIEAVLSGEIGNVNSDQITIQESPVTGVGSISNTAPTSGGKIINIKTIGESLTLPVPQTATPIILNASGEEQLYGTDLRLELKDELEGEISPGSTADLSRISGLDNLKQALEIRFGTLRGELPFHARYGTILPLLIGRKSDAALELLTELEIKEVLLSEPRIASIQKLGIEIEGDVYRIDARVRLIEGNQTVPLNLIARV